MPEKYMKYPPTLPHWGNHKENQYELLFIEEKSVSNLRTNDHKTQSVFNNLPSRLDCANRRNKRSQQNKKKNIRMF